MDDINHVPRERSSVKYGGKSSKSGSLARFYQDRARHSASFDDAFDAMLREVRPDETQPPVLSNTNTSHASTSTVAVNLPKTNASPQIDFSKINIPSPVIPRVLMGNNGAAGGKIFTGIQGWARRLDRHNKRITGFTRQDYERAWKQAVADSAQFLLDRGICSKSNLQEYIAEAQALVDGLSFPLKDDFEMKKRNRIEAAIKKFGKSLSTHSGQLSGHAKVFRRVEKLAKTTGEEELVILKRFNIVKAIPKNGRISGPAEQYNKMLREKLVVYGQKKNKKPMTMDADLDSESDSDGGVSV